MATDRPPDDDQSPWCAVCGVIRPPDGEAVCNPCHWESEENARRDLYGHGGQHKGDSDAIR